MGITIAVSRVRLLLEHEVDVFPVTLESGTGIWEHTASSEHDLQVFLEGVRAGCGMCDVYISLPDPGIPTQPERQIC